MRITGGILRGRKVVVPAGVIRPSMDRMRESVFACLGNIYGLWFLDVFSGSGVIALEAASRGAAFVEAVEHDALKRKTLLENVSISPLRIECRFMPAELYVKKAKNIFDIVFLDPPFPYKYKWELVADIAVSRLVKNGSRILVHHPREDQTRADIAGLERYDERKYGRSVVDFFLAGGKS
ncbi:MAG: RsmD family RNA methyltransferase [Treponema sp.]|nr:RsmD family RNA methyltransferase [Treponema sp.]